MLLKNLFVLFLCVCFSGLINAQDNSFYFSTNIIRSDIHGAEYIREGERLRGFKSNSPKIGFLFSIGRNQKVWRRIYIDISINYQERLPLEKFVFATPDPVVGVSGIMTFAKVASSPQSEMWDASIYKRLPNFRYLHLEFIPSYTFGGKLEASIGLGIFYGRLLNQKQLIFSRKDFPLFDGFFEPPFNAGGTDSYRKSDIGFIPKIKASYPINQQLKVGLSSKAYFSGYALKSPNAAESDSWGRENATTWEVIAVGIDLIYTLKPRKGKR